MKCSVAFGNAEGQDAESDDNDNAEDAAWVIIYAYYNFLFTVNM